MGKADVNGHGADLSVMPDFEGFGQFGAERGNVEVFGIDGGIERDAIERVTWQVEDGDIVVVIDDRTAIEGSVEKIDHGKNEGNHD